MRGFLILRLFSHLGFLIASLAGFFWVGNQDLKIFPFAVRFRSGCEGFLSLANHGPEPCAIEIFFHPILLSFGFFKIFCSPFIMTLPRGGLPWL